MDLRVITDPASEHMRMSNSLDVHTFVFQSEFLRSAFMAPLNPWYDDLVGHEGDEMPELGSVLDSLRRRVAWPVARVVLQTHEIPTGQGWDRTAEKLLNDQQFYAGKTDALVEALQQHALCGEKLSRFYYLSNDQIAALRQALLAQEIPDNVFREHFPLTLPDEVVNALPPQQYHPTAIIRNDDGVGFVYGSIRVIQERVSLETEDLDPQVAAALAQYDEVYGIKEKRHQAMDVIWVPHHGNFVDVRVDYPRGDSLDIALAAHVQIKHQLSALLGHDYLTGICNAFPLIERIYRNPDEGTVVELAFSVPTASLKHEKMRRGKQKLCLRDERYHRAGSDAIEGQIDPFRLSVEWSFRHGDKIWTRPELSINGTLRLTHAAVPTIFDIVVRKCAGLADYEFVRGRVQDYFVAIRQEQEDRAA